MTEPTDTELINWMEENRGNFVLEDDGVLSYAPGADWDGGSFIIHPQQRTFRASLTEAYDRFPLIAKEKADG